MLHGFLTPIKHRVYPCEEAVDLELHGGGADQAGALMLICQDLTTPVIGGCILAASNAFELPLTTQGMTVLGSTPWLTSEAYSLLTANAGIETVTLSIQYV